MGFLEGDNQNEKMGFMGVKEIPVEGTVGKQYFWREKYFIKKKKELTKGNP